jgi:hypothetical protein
VKYLILKDCDWKSYNGRSHQPDGMPTPPVDAADLKTVEGEPLPPSVIDLFVAKGALKPAE